MDAKLKRRLVGAVVLLSLAAIIIPPLLQRDGSGNGGNGTDPVPPRPSQGFTTVEIPLKLPPASHPKPTVVETPTDVKAVATPVPAPAASKSTARSEPTAAPAVPEPQPITSPLQPATDGPQGWVVQVGAFSRSDNAFHLRDRIRNAGFAAFVEQVPGGEGTTYRVRVGPELKRELAEDLQKRLNSKLKLKGLVMSHP